MLQAGEGLARFLGVPLMNVEFTAPAWSGARLGWAALAMLAVWLVGRRVRSGRHRPGDAAASLSGGGGRLTR
jgi:hypothetical protein